MLGNWSRNRYLGFKVLTPRVQSSNTCQGQHQTMCSQAQSLRFRRQASDHHTRLSHDHVSSTRRCSSHLACGDQALFPWRRDLSRAPRSAQKLEGSSFLLLLLFRFCFLLLPDMFFFFSCGAGGLLCGGSRSTWGPSGDTGSRQGMEGTFSRWLFRDMGASAGCSGGTGGTR